MQIVEQEWNQLKKTVESAAEGVEDEKLYKGRDYCCYWSYKGSLQLIGGESKEGKALQRVQQH